MGQASIKLKTNFPAAHPKIYPFVGRHLSSGYTLINMHSLGKLTER